MDLYCFLLCQEQFQQHILLSWDQTSYEILKCFLLCASINTSFHQVSTEYCLSTSLGALYWPYISYMLTVLVSCILPVATSEKSP